MAKAGVRSWPFVHRPWLLALGLALGLLPLRALLAAAGLALAVAAFLQPALGVYLSVVSVPVQQAATLPGGVSATQAAVALALASWGLSRLAPPGRPLAFGPLGWRWAMLLWALLLAASCSPYSVFEGLKAAARWAASFAIWLIAVNTVSRRWQVAALVGCLLLAPAAEAAIGLVQFWAGDGPASFRIAAGSPFVRAYGTIGQPNAFAGYLNMAWPLALALALALTHRRARGGRRLLAVGFWLVAGLLVAGLAASFSRGGWVGAGAGLAGMGAAWWMARKAADSGRGAVQEEHDRDGARKGVASTASPLHAASLRRWLGAALIALVVLGTIVGLGALPGPLAARLASTARCMTFVDPAAVAVTPDTFACVERMAQLRAGWRMFSAHPLTGVGPGSYTAAYAGVTAAPWYISKGHAHNFYLHMAAEAGIIGLAAYLALIAGAAGQALRLARAGASPLRRAVGVGVCGVIAAVAGHNMFENLHVLNFGIQLSGVWALATILAPAREESCVIW